MADLIRQMAEKPGGYMVTAQVVAVSAADGLDVSYRGGLATGLRFLSSYASPGVGDVVQVWVQPGQMFVLDKIGTTSNTLGPNLLPNAGFELGSTTIWPSSWGSAFTEVSRASDPAVSHSSEASVQFNVTGKASGFAANLVQSDPISVDPGVTYRLGSWWYCPINDTALTCSIKVATGPNPEDAQFGDPDGSYVTVASNTAKAQWTEVAGTRTIPAGHFYARVFLHVDVAGGRVANFLYVDDVSLRQQL